MLVLLQNRRFRLLWTGGLFNDISMIMWVMVQGWLALEVTNSPFWVGAVAGAEGVGLASFAVLGGVLIDRVSRRNLLLASSAIQALIAFGLSFLVFSDLIQLWHIMVFAVVDGMVMSVKQPSRMTLTFDVVGRPLLLRATAANFASMASMGIIGPLLAGAVVGQFDIAWAYVGIGAAYVTAFGILANLRGVRSERPQRQPPWRDLKDGVRYVFSTPRVRLLIGLALLTETFGWSHETMLPVMARDVLNVGVSGLGYLIAVASAGATLSMVAMSGAPEARRKGRLMVAGVMGFGAFLALFAASPWFPLSMLLLAAAYAMVMLYESTLSALLQSVVPDEMRGRVLGFQTVTWGMTGISGFHTGAIASATSAPVAIAIGGGVLVVVAALLFRPLSRMEESPVAQPADV